MSGTSRLLDAFLLGVIAQEVVPVPEKPTPLGKYGSSGNPSGGKPYPVLRKGFPPCSTACRAALGPLRGTTLMIRSLFSARCEPNSNRTGRHRAVEFLRSQQFPL